jgi:hypothetical protein
MDDIACLPESRIGRPTKAPSTESAPLNHHIPPASTNIHAELERLSAVVSKLAVAVEDMQTKVDNLETNSADVVAVMQEVQQTPRKTVEEMRRQ